MKEIEIFGLNIEYNNSNIKIKESYKIESEYLMNYILVKFKQETSYESKRTIKSWIKEWKSHNRLYKLGLFKNHTADCDLEENEKWYRLLFYEIIGR